ncbi:DUF1488 family protein [Paraburkholderia oxyphila]|uniref:DUF1488 family protein n=1 Tax=Paraburkholderia oxyphila TaxID=614212 RepID=UPI00047FA61E|nr:DUF1488 family protein [Paraburkholderia oxyphila]
METIGLESRLAPDGKGVVFTLSGPGGSVECVITREALEQYFWLPPGAGEARVLQAFTDGRKRIEAAASRKMLVHAGERVVLTVADFGDRR